MRARNHQLLFPLPELLWLEFPIWKFLIGNLVSSVTMLTISQSKQICMAPYVANESEAHMTSFILQKSLLRLIIYGGGVALCPPVFTGMCHLTQSAILLRLA